MPMLLFHLFIGMWKRTRMWKMDSSCSGCIFPASSGFQKKKRKERAPKMEEPLRFFFRDSQYSYYLGWWTVQHRGIYRGVWDICGLCAIRWAMRLYTKMFVLTCVICFYLFQSPFILTSFNFVILFWVFPFLFLVVSVEDAASPMITVTWVFSTQMAWHFQWNLFVFLSFWGSF